MAFFQEFFHYMLSQTYPVSLNRIERVTPSPTGNSNFHSQPQTLRLVATSLFNGSTWGNRGGAWGGHKITPFEGISELELENGMPIVATKLNI